MMMAAYYPALHAKLGIYIPLIVVNCIIWDERKPLPPKQHCAIVSGCYGYGNRIYGALCCWDRYAEILGAGCLLGHNFIGEEGYPLLLFIMPPGALALAGLIMAFSRLRGVKPMSITMIFVSAVLVNNIVLSPSSWAFVRFSAFLKNIHRLRNGTGSDVCNDDLVGCHTYLIYYRLLVPHQLEFMNTVVFILVIAALVQMVEIVIKKVSPLISGFGYLSAVDHHQLCGSRRCNFGGPERIFAVALGLFRVGERDRLPLWQSFFDGGTAGTHQPKSRMLCRGACAAHRCSDHGSVAFNGVYGLFRELAIKVFPLLPKTPFVPPDLYNDKISKT